MDYPQALAWLDSHIDHESSASGVIAGHVEGLSLGPMRQLLGLMGDPQQQIPAIHITGTNGKGSTAAMVTSLLMANGLSVGTYSSPHISAVNERITRNGIPIPDDDLAEVITGVAAVSELVDGGLSWFELVTAAAFRWFAEVPVEVMVIEVGLLGRHDATNVVDAEVAVITAIQGDHTDFAPGWEVAIATEKAGIISGRSTAVLGDIDPGLVPIFETEGPRRLLRYGSDFHIAGDRVAIGGHLVDIAGTEDTYEDVFVPARGAHQVVNASIAVAVVEAFFERALDPDVVREGFASVQLPGRFEVLGYKPLVVIDGAHNADAIAGAARTLDDEFVVVGRRIVVVGLLDGRDPRRAVDAITGLRPDLVVVTSLESDRSIGADVVASLVDDVGLACEVVADPLVAVQHAMALADEEDLVMIIGSFRLIAPARSVIIADS